MQTGLYTGAGNKYLLRVMLINASNDLGGTVLFREQHPLMLPEPGMVAVS